MLSDDELDDVLDATQQALSVMVRGTPLPSSLTERLLLLLRLTFPEWDICYEHRPDKVEWFGVLKHDISAEMRASGVIRTVRRPSGTRLATELARQSVILTQFNKEGRPVYFPWGISPTPPPDPESSTCRFCAIRIIKVKTMPVGNEYWSAAEPQSGVALQRYCRARPIPEMGPGSFGSHEPTATS